MYCFYIGVTQQEVLEEDIGIDPLAPDISDIKLELKDEDIGIDPLAPDISDIKLEIKDEDAGINPLDTDISDIKLEVKDEDYHFEEFNTEAVAVKRVIWEDLNPVVRLKRIPELDQYVKESNHFAVPKRYTFCSSKLHTIKEPDLNELKKWFSWEEICFLSHKPEYIRMFMRDQETRTNIGTELIVSRILNAMLSNTKNKKWNCKTCKNMRGSEVPRFTKTQPMPYKCSTCQRQFDNGIFLHRHLCALYSRIIVFTCFLCERTYVTQRRFEEHFVTCNPKCGGRSKLSKSRTETKHSSKGNKNFIPAPNGHVFDKNNSKEIFNCNICNKSFRLKLYYETHLKKHLGVVPFKCKICKKGFFWKSSLNTHFLKAHFGITRFQCQICSEGFSRKDRLTSHHFKVHLGVYPFSCQICSKGFTDRNHLKIHLLQHSGKGPPFKCKICREVFDQEATFKAHLLKHCEAPPKEYGIRSDPFAEKKRFKAHLQAHSKAPPYKRKICTQGFSQRNRLSPKNTLSRSFEHSAVKILLREIV